MGLHIKHILNPKVKVFIKKRSENLFNLNKNYRSFLGKLLGGKIELKKYLMRDLDDHNLIHIANISEHSDKNEIMNALNLRLFPNSKLNEINSVISWIKNNKYFTNNDTFPTCRIIDSKIVTVELKYPCGFSETYFFDDHKFYHSYEIIQKRIISLFDIPKFILDIFESEVQLILT